MNPRKKRRIVTAVALVVLGVSLPGMGDTGPETITLDQLTNLYEPVLFDHLVHQEMYDCSRCHHGEGDKSDQNCMACHGSRPLETTAPCAACHLVHDTLPKKESGAADDSQGGKYHMDTPGLVGAYHLGCRKCHLEDGGPVGCQQCHAFTTRGKQLFHESP